MKCHDNMPGYQQIICICKKKIRILQIVDNQWGHIKIKTFCDAKNFTARDFENS